MPLLWPSEDEGGGRSRRMRTSDGRTQCYVRPVEWLWWAALLFVVIGWPVLLVGVSILLRRVRGRSDV
jgi:hypothetical protein